MLACVGGVGCGDACGGCVPGRGLFARRWAAVASRGAEGRALLREGVVAATGCLPRPEGLLCSGGGVNEWRVRECGAGGVRLPWPRGPCLNPGGVEVAVREVLRGAVGVARGEGEAWAVGPVISAMSPWSLVGSCRASLAAVSAAAPWPGWASLVRSDSHLVCSSCCQLQASLLAEVTGCVWSDGAFRFSSRRFSSLFHRVRPRVPGGCRGAPLWCSPLPFRSVIEGLDRGVFSELSLSTPINYGAKVLVKLLIVQMKTCFSSFGDRFLTFETENTPIFGLRRGKNWHFVCRRLVRISLKT